MISGRRKHIAVVDSLENRSAGAYFNPENGKIFVCRVLDFQDLFCALSVELAHKELADTNSGYSLENMGFNAYCVSYIICKKNNIDVSDYRFYELRDNLREGDTKSVRAQLTIIRDTAETISARMAKSLEQTRGLHHKEQER